MSSIVINVIGGLPTVMTQALLEVDVDTDAECVIIFDRHFTDGFYQIFSTNGGAFKTIVPVKYATSSELIVGITDRDRIYNAKFVDGVQAELIDGNIVNIRP
ncbi:hypothetical protein [Shewanella sp. DW31]|uniref:hypothetical protein n=1 Tax=Shewanella sp. DW31 TaxID=2699422 RepID=UPI0018E36AE0|nr:hypothetical protein [Shewanella sp. DW31]MBI1676022.1 hypothetical protein [Shewanella sp. DW31]